uniref:Uncharacterized protein n=1 Tax=Anguilla anguilla TaxID=7936 RepID=A0A0E9TUQ9_ANGAN
MCICPVPLTWKGSLCVEKNQSHPYRKVLFPTYNSVCMPVYNVLCVFASYM